MSTRHQDDPPIAPVSRVSTDSPAMAAVHGLLKGCAVLAFVLSASAAVQAQSDPVPSDHNQESPQEADEEVSPSDAASAEDILQSLLNRRPAHGVIPSARMRARGAVPPERPLFPEGTRVVDQVGSLSHDGALWLFVPAEPHAASSVKLLPNAVLEAMARSASGTEGPTHFAVSGELTVFQGENYLLPRLAERAHLVPAEPPMPAPTTVAVDAPAPDVLDILRRQRPEKEMLPPAHSQAPLPRLSTAVRPVQPDGMPLVSRPGRVTQEGLWWVFVFESDRPDSPEPPLKLLPCRSLELMIQAHARGTAGLVFIVSGEITAFDGENYLLVRSALRGVEMGNIRK